MTLIYRSIKKRTNLATNNVNFIPNNEALVSTAQTILVSSLGTLVIS